MWCVLMSAIYLHKDMYVSIIDAFCSMLQDRREGGVGGVKGPGPGPRRGP